MVGLRVPSFFEASDAWTLGGLLPVRGDRVQRDVPSSSQPGAEFIRARSLDPRLQRAVAERGTFDVSPSALVRGNVPASAGRELGFLGDTQFAGDPFSTTWNPLGALTAPVVPEPKPRDVRRAETWLKRLGHNPGRIDTALTPQSRAALSDYQRAVGLDPTGQLDPRTLRSLQSTAKRVKKNGRNYLTPGMKGARVKKLQQRLQRLGDFQGTPDGIYGASTTNAVRTFRRRHPGLQQGLKSFGKKAQQALRTELDNIAHDPYRTRVKPAGQQRLDRLAAEEAADGGIGPGSPREVIAHVQKQLTAAGYNPNRTDGVWDNHTEAMLHQFQRRANLPETERVGSNAWSRLSASTMETNSATSPKQRIGERSRAVLRTERLLKKAGLNPGEIDGVYTKATERAADKIRKLFGAARANGVSARTIRQIKKRIKQLHSFQKPVDFRLTPISEFRVPDAEGAPSSNGTRYHAGKDWFAPGGTAVRSPVAGKIVEVTPSSTNSGQVFGGTVKVQARDGKVWVFRHVDPRGVRVGERVNAGERIARVTNWADGPDHTHIELWKSLRGGYRFENMIDPMRYLKRFL